MGANAANLQFMALAIIVGALALATGWLIGELLDPPSLISAAIPNQEYLTAPKG